MTNDEMKANRFARWAKARKTVAAIKEQLAKGRTVQITTYTKAVRYKAVHAEMFKATRNGAFVQRGKSWDCIDYCAIRVFA